MPQVFPFDKKTENEDQRPRGNLEPRILESGLETHSSMELTNYKLTTRIPSLQDPSIPQA